MFYSIANSSTIVCLHCFTTSCVVMWFQFGSLHIFQTNVTAHTALSSVIQQLLVPRLTGVVEGEDTAEEDDSTFAETGPWSLRKTLTLRAPTPSSTRRRLTESFRTSLSWKVEFIIIVFSEFLNQRNRISHCSSFCVGLYEDIFSCFFTLKLLKIFCSRRKTKLIFKLKY